jgi:biopolymer transport protein ExbD
MAIRLSLEEDRVEENHEINVTPFIDVILVLLIIFMVAAPLSTVDVNVDLPASTAKPAPRPDKPLFLTLKSDLSLVLGEVPVKREELSVALDLAAQGDKEQRVFVRADRSVSYGNIMELMNLLRGAGYLKIGLVGLEAGPAEGPSPQAESAPASSGMASQPQPAEAKP